MKAILFFGYYKGRESFRNGEYDNLKGAPRCLYNQN